MKLESKISSVELSSKHMPITTAQKQAVRYQSFRLGIGLGQTQLIEKCAEHTSRLVFQQATSYGMKSKSRRRTFSNARYMTKSFQGNHESWAVSLPVRLTAGS